MSHYSSLLNLHCLWGLPWWNKGSFTNIRCEREVTMAPDVSLRVP